MEKPTQGIKKLKKLRIDGSGELSRWALTTYLIDGCVYVEEMTTHRIKMKLPASMTMAEIPISKRKEGVRTRFGFTVSPNGLPEWNISYSAAKFEHL